MSIGGLQQLPNDDNFISQGVIWINGKQEMYHKHPICILHGVLQDIYASKG